MTTSKLRPSTWARRPSSVATWATVGLRSTLWVRTSAGHSVEPMPEPLEERPALCVRVDVVPAERDEVALQQLANGECLAGRAPPDQPCVAEALAQQPLTTRDHGPQEEVSQLVGAGDQRAQRVGLDREQLGLLCGDAAGDRRLAGEHGDVGGEGAGLALREVAIAVGLAVDDVDGSREHDVQGRIALTLGEDHLARRVGTGSRRSRPAARSGPPSGAGTGSDRPDPGSPRPGPVRCTALTRRGGTRRSSATEA